MDKIKKLLCKICLCCSHPTGDKYKILKNPKRLCNKSDDFLHLGGYINYYSKQVCCRCGRVSYLFCRAYDYETAIKYPTYKGE